MRKLLVGGTERISRYDFGRLLMNIMDIRHARMLQYRQHDLPMPAPRPYDVSLDISKALALGPLGHCRW